MDIIEYIRRLLVWVKYWHPDNLEAFQIWLSYTKSDENQMNFWNISILHTNMFDNYPQFT